MAKNHSFTLDINPKVSNYQTNGTGRDTYIKFNNGGFKTIAVSDSSGPKIISKDKVIL
jgi:hypothetical protein